ERRALAGRHRDYDLVFATKLGTALGPESVSARFKAALRRAGLDVAKRVHDLRHGCAMMLLEAGEPVPAVSAYLGHASPAVTMGIYAHAMPGAKRRAAERLAAIMQQARRAAETTEETAVSAG